MSPRRGTSNWVTKELADLTGRSPAEIELFMGAAAAVTAVVVALRTYNFFADLGSATTSSRSRRRRLRAG